MLEQTYARQMWSSITLVYNRNSWEKKRGEKKEKKEKLLRNMSTNILEN